MNRNNIPTTVFAVIDKYERDVEHLTQQVARTQDAIDNARQRLSGGFQKDQEYRDLRATLDQLITDRPILENKLRDAQITLANSKQFLEQLPADLMLQPVKRVAQNGYDLAQVQRRIADAEDEIKRLRAV